MLVVCHLPIYIFIRRVVFVFYHIDIINCLLHGADICCDGKTERGHVGDDSVEPEGKIVRASHQVPHLPGSDLKKKNLKYFSDVPFSSSFVSFVKCFK